MGQITGRPLIVEFNGIPGAGKTTTALEVGKSFRNKKIRELSPKKITGYRGNYRDIIWSKEIRDVYLIFLRVLLLIRPVTRERLKFMNMTFGYWLGIRKLCIPENQKNGICVLDQGVIQGFVSMAYLGKIRNEDKYYECIRKVISRLDNVVFVNCIVDADTSIMRMYSRKSKGSRLYQIRDRKEQKEILKMQNRQLESIREKTIKRAITIHMKESVEYNAGKIVEHCMRCL